MIPYNWNTFVSHLKSLIIIISQMSFFTAMNRNIFKIKKLTNNHFQMQNNKHYEVGHFLKFFG